MTIQNDLTNKNSSSEDDKNTTEIFNLNCTPQCKKHKCPCKKAGLECTPTCHTNVNRKCMKATDTPSNN